MTLKLLKIEAEDSWSDEAEPPVRQAVRQVSRPAPAPRPAALAPSGGVSARGLGALRRHGLLPVEGGADGDRADGSSPDRGRALEKARELVDQAYAVPDGGWVEGGGLWTADRVDRRR